VVEKIRGAKVERERGWTVRPIAADLPRPAQIRIEMQESGHRPKVARNIAIDGVDREEPKRSGCHSGPGRGCVRRTVVENAIAVIVGARG
jgi:hypothetical protein